MNMTTQQLATALNIPLDRASIWIASIHATMTEFGISTPARQTAFLAQIGHESGGLASTSESFNYSVQGLVATFGNRISGNAAVLGRQKNEKMVPVDRQMKIANIVYAGRYGNGAAASGDGWRFRGRGLKQVTFHDNYVACAAALGVDLLNKPDLLATDNLLAARSAGWFWQSINGNSYADCGNFDGLSTRINGAGISKESLAARQVRFSSCKKALSVA